MISLPWIALSLVTELVTVALHCPGLPSGLVTELVTRFPSQTERGKYWLAIMQALFSLRAALGVNRVISDGENPVRRLLVELSRWRPLDKSSKHSCSTAWLRHYSDVVRSLWLERFEFSDVT